jgi:hypothetical protein
MSVNERCEANAKTRRRKKLSAKLQKNATSEMQYDGFSSGFAVKGLYFMLLVRAILS